MLSLISFVSHLYDLLPLSLYHVYSNYSLSSRKDYAVAQMDAMETSLRTVREEQRTACLRARVLELTVPALVWSRSEALVRGKIRNWNLAEESSGREFTVKNANVRQLIF